MLSNPARLVLEDLLDLIQLAAAQADLLLATNARRWRGTAQRMLQWLAATILRAICCAPRGAGTGPGAHPLPVGQFPSRRQRAGGSSARAYAALGTCRARGHDGHLRAGFPGRSGLSRLPQQLASCVRTGQVHLPGDGWRLVGLRAGRVPANRLVLASTMQRKPSLPTARCCGR